MRGVKKKDHKYIAKVPTKFGRYRYFYTQAELNAYYNELKTKNSKYDNDAFDSRMRTARDKDKIIYKKSYAENLYKNKEKIDRAKTKVDRDFTAAYTERDAMLKGKTRSERAEIMKSPKYKAAQKKVEDYYKVWEKLSNEEIKTSQELRDIWDNKLED